MFYFAFKKIMLGLLVYRYHTFFLLWFSQVCIRGRIQKKRLNVKFAKHVFLVVNTWQNICTITVAKKTPFQCELCPVSFFHSSDLEVHSRIHTGEKPIKCDICKKKFNVKGNMVRHRKIYNEIKPFECKLCCYKSSTEQNLERHVRTHTGEKPFHCDVFHKDFLTRFNMVKHMKTHTS